MCQALRELMKDEIAASVREGELRGERRGELRGERRGELRGEQRGREEGIRVLVDTYRAELGLDDQAIIGKIAEKFHLSGEQARAYVLPQGV